MINHQFIKSKSLTLSIALLLFGFISYGQQTIVVSASEATGNGGSASYSIGQVATNFAKTSNGSLSEGVQHPYEIWLITNLDETVAVELNVSVYPNPTQDALSLEIKDKDYALYQFKLYDINGKILQSVSVSNKSSIIDMTDLPPSTYLLKVFQNESATKTFRILKN
jgi:hypothetical protein